MNVSNGPEGALYLVDMARGIVQHKAFLTHYLEANIKARKLEPVKLPKETAEIMPFLAQANGHLRDTAQRVLVERDEAAVVRAISKLVTDASNEHGRVTALWTLERSGQECPRSFRGGGGPVSIVVGPTSHVDGGAHLRHFGISFSV